MSISSRLLAVAAISITATTSARSDDTSPATVARTFTAETLSGCLGQFDASGLKPREEFYTRPESPEATRFEAMGIKCDRVVMNPAGTVVPGKTDKPLPGNGCRFLFARTFVSVSYGSPQDLRAMILYPKHKFIFDIDSETMSAHVSPSVTAVADFDQLVRTASTAIAECVRRAPK